MSTQQDTERIRQALQEGRLTVPDSTGYHKSMYATCPRDGSRAPLYMTVKHGGTITGAIFRCPNCGERFEAQVEEIYAA